MAAKGLPNPLTSCQIGVQENERSFIHQWEFDKQLEEAFDTLVPIVMVQEIARILVFSWHDFASDEYT